MTRIEETIEIKRPVEDVFAFTIDAKSWPKWHESNVEAEQTSPGEVGVGTTFRLKTHAMGQTTEWTAKVTEYDPYKRWKKVMESKSAIIEDTQIFEQIEGGTKYTLVYDVKVSGFAKLLSSRISSGMRTELEHGLKSLKTILETES